MIIFENYIKENKAAFVAKVVDISQKLGINPNWLMAIMFHETAGTLNSKIVNNIGCVGLIQFCPNGALSMFGKTVAQMQAMSNVEQLEYVYQFFKPNAGKYKSMADMHLYAFVPSVFPYRYNNTHVIGSEVSATYPKIVYHAAMDFDKNGILTIADFRNYLDKWAKDWKVDNYLSSNNTTNTENKEENETQNNSFLWLALGGYAGYLVATGQIKI